MKAHKRNPFRGMGLDKRQARRMRRRVAQGKPTAKGGVAFFVDEFALLWERDLKPLYDLMPERVFETCPEPHEFKPTRRAYLGVGQKDLRRNA